MYFTEPKSRGEKKGEAEIVVAISVALPPLFRRPPSPLSLAAVYQFSYGSLFVLNIFIVDLRWLSCSYVIMSYRRSNFMEMDDMFLQFEDDLDNIAGGSSSVDDNTGSSSQKTTPTPRRPDVGREYIEVVKGDLKRLFVLDFNDQVMNRFVEHQMLTTFKEFRVDCHRHFKKYSGPEEARANPPNALVGRDED
ncbi:CACTA en-spm transposon protein [Cucumis melo var. makuwa]|uniref:CACTA en-spm transposon protein n=1 Tax=Cucumis melo var. makuwa TaxID=1194695 RepID=A0A5A7SJ91_CUCMM|nr:CACTA en-spm transposon protein [Cucumis melo var. makuwa]